MKSRGDAAERAAERHLLRHGLRLIERNHRCRMGEIDLVMRDGETLVFVEVRMRSNAGFGGAAASIVRSKQQRIVRAAQHFLAGLAEPPPCRFDVVLVEGVSAARIEWLRNAFDA